jgi:DNA invertase Pin-like site-specific DNA recombinase
MRCAIYARLSIEREASSDNVETQIEECEAHIDEQGWTVAHIFSDSDISASKYSKKPRPGYGQLLEAVRAGEIECIVITEMPRLYRRLEELLELMHLAETTALKRIETTDGNYYDLSSGMGVHNAVAAVNTAVLESRRTSDRMKRKRRAEARAGKAHGGIRPYGYEKGGRTINESEADVIRECRDLILAGEPVLSVVKMLNLREVPTANGRRWHNRNLEQILTSRRIAGIRTHNGAEYPAAWPAIISKEDSDRLRLILGDRRVPKNRTPKTYLLSSMVYCGICAKPLIASGAHRNGVTQRKYRCRGKDSSGNVYGCGKIVRTAEPLETLVSEAVLYRCDSPEVADSLRNAERPQIGELMDEYNARKLKLRELVEDYASGLLNREQLAQAKAVVEEALERTKLRLAKLESGRALASIPADKTIREAWADGSLTWKRSLISLLVKKVVVTPSSPGGRRWSPQDSQDGRSWAFDPTAIRIVWRV